MTPVPVVETPLQTAWPALLAAALLVPALGAAARALAPRREERGLLLLVLAVALLVRLLVVPAWGRHLYDGHEADYWDLFRGARALSRGGPLFYPAAQWLWAGLGRVLPHEPHVPVLVSVGFGLLAVGALGLAFGRLAGEPRVGALAAGVLALHPAHAAWSSAAYPVIQPQALAALGLLALVSGGQDPDLRPRDRLALGAVGGLALALAVALRLEVGLLALPAAALGLLPLVPGGPPARARVALVPGLALGALLAVAAARPLLFPGELPGAGERTLAFAANVDLLAVYAPFDTGPVLAMLGICAGLAAWRLPGPTLVLLLATAGHHLVLAGFDDMGERHALSALWGLGWVLGLAPFAFPPGRRRGAFALAAGALLVSASGLRERRALYYAGEEAFRAHLEAVAGPDLPRADLATLRAVLAPPGRCGLVAEDPRAAQDPPRSHFNLLDPAEAEALRGPEGCLRWCLELEDWRWSSRAVRDRARRVAHLYELRPVALIEDPATGYACLLQDLGRRRR